MFKPIRSSCSLRLCLLAAMAAFLLPAPADAQQGKWARKAPFPEASEELLGAAAGGKLYVFAGLAPGWKPKALVYDYDPASDKWVKRKPMALPSHHVGIVEHQGKIYAFGGFVLPQAGPPAWEPIDNAWEYDPAADAWKALKPMPTKRGAPVAAAAGGKIYIIGGATSNPNEAFLHPQRPHRSIDTVEEYDPATDSWRPRTAMPTPRNHAVAGVVNGKVYVIGGRTGTAFITAGSSNIDVVEEYDPAKDQWGPPRAKMPTARSAMAAGVIEGRIYVCGGESQDARMMQTFRTLEAYDPASNTWSVLPPMSVPRHGLAGAAIGDRLHFVSGSVQSAGTGVHVDADYHDVFELSR
jgi:N-acetylneuraminic acid mutarotase